MPIKPTARERVIVRRRDAANQDIPRTGRDGQFRLCGVFDRWRGLDRSDFGGRQ